MRRADDEVVERVEQVVLQALGDREAGVLGPAGGAAEAPGQELFEASEHLQFGWRWFQIAIG